MLLLSDNNNVIITLSDKIMSLSDQIKVIFTTKPIISTTKQIWLPLFISPKIPRLVNFKPYFRLARFKRELITPKSGGGGAGEGFDVAKTGDARIGFVGFPSVSYSVILHTFWLYIMAIQVKKLRLNNVFNLLYIW